MNRQKFQEGMAILCAQYQCEANEFLLKGYWMVLKELTDEEFERAVVHVLNNRKYNKMPVAAEMKEAIYGSIEDRALSALIEVEKAVRSIGSVMNVDFGDPVTHLVIESMGGWCELCSVARTEDVDWKFAKQDFLKRYQMFAKKSPSELNAPAFLYGGIDREADGRKLTGAKKEEWDAMNQRLLVRVGNANKKQERSHETPAIDSHTVDTGPDYGATQRINSSHTRTVAKIQAF